jgi:acetolactate synthase-1/2/3 large subunit
VENEMQARSPIRPQQVMGELQRQMRSQDIVVTDASFSIGWVTSFFDVRRAGRGCLFPRGSATLGFGLPAAIGARLAAPADSRVVCVAGDGGIGYALGELATCRKYGLRITLLVLNNSGLGYSRWGERLSEGHYENVEYPATDFALIARGFGCAGLRVDAPDQVGDALAQALEAEGPTVLDVGIDKWETPELVLRKKRGTLREQP